MTFVSPSKYSLSPENSQLFCKFPRDCVTLQELMRITSFPAINSPSTYERTNRIHTSTSPLCNSLFHRAGSRKGRRGGEISFACYIALWESSSRDTVDKRVWALQLPWNVSNVDIGFNVYKPEQSSKNHANGQSAASWIRSPYFTDALRKKKRVSRSAIKTQDVESLWPGSSTSSQSCNQDACAICEDFSSVFTGNSIYRSTIFNHSVFWIMCHIIPTVNRSEHRPL